MFYGFDVAFFSIFLAEFILRLLADGGVLTPRAYFRSFWNVLDFLIIIFMMIDIFIFTYIPDSQGASRFFRAARAARPLRIVNQFTSLKHVFRILVKGWKNLLRGLVLLFVVIFAFAIWAVNLFAGVSAFCNDSTIPDAASCIGEYIPPAATFPYPVPRYDWKTLYHLFLLSFVHLFFIVVIRFLLPFVFIAIRYCPYGLIVVILWNYLCVICHTCRISLCIDTLSGRVWSNPRYYSFDNVGVAILTLFEIASTEDWVNVYWAMRDATAPGEQPVRDANMPASIFFVPFMIVGYMFIVQLFVGVVANNFQTQEGMALLTDEQARWRDLQRQLNLLHPSKQPPPRRSKKQTLGDAERATKAAQDAEDVRKTNRGVLSQMSYVIFA